MYRNKKVDSIILTEDMNTYIQTDNEINKRQNLISEGLGGLLPDVESFLSKFKVKYPHSLFEPDFNLLRQFRCPICTRKLYWNLDKTIARCKSKQKDKFIIKAETLKKYE